MADTDARSWRTISQALLTDEGDWLVHATIPFSGTRDKSGDVEVIARNTRSALERRYQAGNARDGAGGLQLSPSGRWIAFRSAGTTQASVVAVELASGKRVEFEGVQQFAFIVDAGGDDAVVLHHYPPADLAGVAQLELLRLPDATLARDAATTFAVNEQRTRVAWSGAKGVGLWDAATRRVRVLGGAPDCAYDALTWSSNGAALAALRICKEAPIAIATFRRLADSSAEVEVHAPKGIPQGFAISTNAFMTPEYERRPVLVWRDDERGLFFGVRRAGQAQAAADGQQLATVVLWHARDQLPAEKAVAARLNRSASLLSYMSLDDGRYVRVEDEQVHVIDVPKKGRFALAYDTDAYRRPADPNFSRDPHFVHYRDYYLIDLRSGERRRILEKLLVLSERQLSARPQLSPDGATLLYQDNGDYIACDVSSGKRLNLTAGLPTQFYFEENSRNRRLLRQTDEEISSPLQGWSADGRYVLMSDYYDVWALPLRKGAARNLTGNGRRELKVYQRTLLDGLSGRESLPRESPADLDRPMFFRVTDLKSGDTGLARRDPGTDAGHPLDWQHARTWYYKARGADRYFMSRESSVEFQTFFTVDASFRIAEKLTDVNAQQRELRWPPGARLITYEVGGAALRGILHLPVGYESGRSYPTIVSIYERQSQMLHNYLAPGDPALRWLMQGYAVLMPDIQPRVNEAGKAALEAVLSAVEAAVATGAVDRDRLGLVGHSHGGFETNYIVTRTGMFKAAVPQAGWSDLLSDYGSVYERYGVPASYVIERSQPYVAGPWWEEWDAFIENSPIFQARNISTPLLIAHGDNDRLVHFSQAVELFNTLRRMGNEQVVLLQYVGVDHAFAGAAGEDLHRRMEQFFDHFLKGYEAPRWWSAGTSGPTRIQ